VLRAGLNTIAATRLSGPVLDALARDDAEFVSEEISGGLKPAATDNREVKKCYSFSEED
jgi:hypothetical protein